MFSFLALTFLLLAVGEFTASLSFVRFPHILLITSTQYINSVTKAGGIFGALTAFIAYYIGLSELLSSEDMAIIHLPLGIIPKRVDPI
jgi:succinate-acetate transporter protein